MSKRGHSGVIQEEEAIRDVNIETVGRGLWYNLHLRAAKSNRPMQRRKVFKYMEFLAANMGCAECREHMTDYLNKTRHLRGQIRDADGMLYYTWYLHTLVNQRKHKPNTAYDAVKDFYMKTTDDRNCDGFCPVETQ